MSNPWASSFDEYRQTIIGEGKGKKEPRWQDDDCDGKWYEKSDTDGKISKREKKAKAKHYKEEKYDNTKSPDYKKKKKALAKKHGGAKNIKGHPQYEHHGIDIEHLDGTQTQIVDVVKAPKMVAAPKLSNWREDFVWDEALKTPKLELEGDGKKDVKNKIEINPTVETEGYMSKDKEGHTTGGFRISNKEAKKAKERLKKKYKKEEVEQVDEMDGSKLAIGATAGIIGGGLRLMQSAKNAAERLRQKKTDAMNKALGEEAEKKNLDEVKVKYYSGQDRNPNTGLPKGLKAAPVRTEKEVNKKLDRTTLAQSYDPEGDIIQEKPGDGWIGPTVGGVGIPNPVRITKDVVDKTNRNQQKKVDTINKISPGSASMGKVNYFNKGPSAASQKLLGLSHEPEGKVISEGPSDVSDARTKAQYKGPGAPGLDAHKERIAKHKASRGKKKVKEGYQRNPERDTRSARQRRMDDPDRGINSQAFRDFMAAQQKPSKPKKKKDVKEGIVTELNRYEKETGKSSGSMNMPKGRPTKKGGTSSPVMRAVRTSIRKETGKPEGQQKKEKGKKPPKAGEYGARRSPKQIVQNRRAQKKAADAAMRDTRGT